MITACSLWRDSRGRMMGMVNMCTAMPCEMTQNFVHASACIVLAALRSLTCSGCSIGRHVDGRLVLAG